MSAPQYQSLFNTHITNVDFSIIDNLQVTNALDIETASVTGSTSNWSELQASLDQHTNAISINTTQVGINTSTLSTITLDLSTLQSDLYFLEDMVVANEERTDSNSGKINALEILTASHTITINTNAGNITLNANGITLNANNITLNANNITANASSISQNTSGIVSNLATLTEHAGELTSLSNKNFSQDLLLTHHDAEIQANQVFVMEHSLIDHNFLPLTGGRMTGNLEMTGTNIDGVRRLNVHEVAENFPDIGVNFLDNVNMDGTLAVDTIVQKTEYHGVEIEGMLLRDSMFYTDQIAQYTSAGVTIGGLVKVANFILHANTINEFYAGSGVRIENITLRDGLIQGWDMGLVGTTTMDNNTRIQNLEPTVGANTGRISTNEDDIATNLTAIQTNYTAINLNMNNIGSNLTKILQNTVDIALLSTGQFNTNNYYFNNSTNNTGISSVVPGEFDLLADGTKAFAVNQYGALLPMLGTAANPSLSVYEAATGLFGGPGALNVSVSSYPAMAVTQVATTFANMVLPDANETRSLGSATYKWDELHTREVNTDYVQFSNNVTTSTTVPNKLGLWGTSLGISILGNTLGFVVPSTDFHRFYVGGINALEIGTTNTMSSKHFLPQANTDLTLGSASNEWDELHAREVNTDFVQFSNNVTTSTTVPNKLSLYSNTHGFSILASTLGFIVPSTDFHRFYIGGTKFLEIGATHTRINTHFVPQTDNSRYLGLFANRWIAIYCVNGTIQTSDERMKNSIEPIPSGLGLGFINKLRPVSFKWNDTVNTDEDTGEVTTIEHTRTHLGLIAQEVEASIEECGETLSTTDIIDNDALVEEDGTDMYGIRYHALIAPLIKAVQELSMKCDSLQAEINILKA